MNEKEILEITLHNSHCEEMRFIQHPRNPDVSYVLMDQVHMHCEDGVWRVAIVYSDGVTKYCRRADDFSKFSECK